MATALLSLLAHPRPARATCKWQAPLFAPWPEPASPLSPWCLKVKQLKLHVAAPCPSLPCLPLRSALTLRGAAAAPQQLGMADPWRKHQLGLCQHLRHSTHHDRTSTLQAHAAPAHPRPAVAGWASHFATAARFLSLIKMVVATGGHTNFICDWQCFVNLPALFFILDRH